MIGNDVTVTVGGQAGNFELIVMLPVMAYNLLQSIGVARNRLEQFRGQVH